MRAGVDVLLAQRTVDVFGNHLRPRENIARSRPARHLLHPLARAVVIVGGAGAAALGFDAIFAVIGVGVQRVVGQIPCGVVAVAGGGSAVGWSLLMLPELGSRNSPITLLGFRWHLECRGLSKSRLLCCISEECFPLLVAQKNPYRRTECPY